MKTWKTSLVVVAGVIALGLGVRADEKEKHAKHPHIAVAVKDINEAKGALKHSKLWGHADNHFENAEKGLADAEKEIDEGVKYFEAHPPKEKAPDKPAPAADKGDPKAGAEVNAKHHVEAARAALKDSAMWGHADNHLEKAEDLLGKASGEIDAGVRYGEEHKKSK